MSHWRSRARSSAETAGLMWLWDEASCSCQPSQATSAPDCLPGAAVRWSFGSERLREVLTLLLAGPAAVVRFPHGTWASTTDGRGRRGPAPPGLLEHRKPECAGRSPSGTGE